MTVSAVRALFSVANRPEVVSLAGGMPNIADLPRQHIAGLLSELITKHGPQAMQYGSGQGELFMREAICEVMAEEQIEADPANVLITCGSQQGLDLVTRLFCDPGDVVLVESPSYVGALGTFNSYQTEIHHVAMDEEGLIPEAMREAVTNLRAAGKKVKFLYTVPNFNNPTGITQTLERRKELVALARELNVVIVEDNPYGLLNLDQDPIPAMRSLDADNIIYLGSFSKTFAPGFRIGWVLAPPTVTQKLVIAQEAAVLSPPVFSQFAVTSYLREWDWREQLVKFRDMYRERRNAMLAGLETYMPEGTSWTHPLGGFFVWLQLPGDLDSEQLLQPALDAKVAYVPGPAFYANGDGGRFMRLSFCFPPSERIIEGTRRLGAVITDALDH